MLSVKSILAPLFLLTAAGQALAQSVTVIPANGTPQTRFVVTAGGFANCPCQPPHNGTPAFSIDGNSIDAVAPFSTDTVSFIPTVGQHIVRAVFNSECGNPSCTNSYDVRDTFTITSHEPVLLIHGFCGSADDWDTFDSVLSDSGFTVDRLEYGSQIFSDQPSAYVAVLKAKLNEMNVDRVAIVAHSMGGLIARDYMHKEIASGNPNKVVQLITLGTPHHGNDLAPWLLGVRAFFDHGCFLRGLGYPCDSVSGKLKNTFGCQGDRRSTLALLDMSPASQYMNELNYGAQSDFYDPKRSHGWEQHDPETTLIQNTYYASIAGTATICKLRGMPIWGLPGDIENDGVVAAESAMLSNTQTFRAQDRDLPMGRLTHAQTPPFLCQLPYSSSDTLARKVSRILRTAPSAPPVTSAESANASGLDAGQALPDDSLRNVPAIVDTISPGRIAQATVTIPASSLMLVSLVANDARLSLKRPDGSVIAVTDTSAMNGIFFMGEVGTRFEGFRITNPMAGVWTIRVDATSASAQQQYGCLVSYATSLEVRVATQQAQIYAPDSIRIRAELLDAGSRRTDVTWSCSVMGPDGVRGSLALFDDGAHGDSLSGDGIYGNKLASAAGLGAYLVTATGTIPGGKVISGEGSCQVVNYNDLIVAESDIRLSRNVVNVGDSVNILVTVHNGGVSTAVNTPIEVWDDEVGYVIGTTTASIPSGGAVTVQVPWVVSDPDSHVIRVNVSPYVFDREINYANNGAQRLVVLGSPVGVEPEVGLGGNLWLAPPRPNPSNALITLSFSLSRRGPASLELFDVLGRRLCRWMWSDLAPGLHTVEWDGRHANGSALAPGIVMCRLSAEGQVRTRKLVIER